MANFWFSDEQWALPQDTRGMPRVDDRRVLSGIVHALKSGGRWSDCPEHVYGPKKTLYNRFRRWAWRGVWERIFARFAGVEQRKCRKVRPVSGDFPDLPADAAAAAVQSVFSQKIPVGLIFLAIDRKPTIGDPVGKPPRDRSKIGRLLGIVVEALESEHLSLSSRLRVWLIKAALISSSCRPPDHEADAGDGNPGNGAFDGCLDILCRTAAASRPGEGTLRHPAAGQQLEPLGCSLSRGSGISVTGFWKFRKRKFIARWRIQDILEGSLKTIRAPLKSDALRRPAQ